MRYEQLSSAASLELQDGFTRFMLQRSFTPLRCRETPPLPQIMPILRISMGMNWPRDSPHLSAIAWKCVNHITLQPSPRHHESAARWGLPGPTRCKRWDCFPEPGDSVRAQQQERDLPFINTLGNCSHVHIGDREVGDDTVPEHTHIHTHVHKTRFVLR